MNLIFIKFILKMFSIKTKFYLEYNFFKLKNKLQYKKCKICMYKKGHHCTYYNHYPVIYGKESCENWKRRIN